MVIPHGLQAFIMSSSNRHPSARPLSSSRSHQSFYAPAASSRPFLNMLNPLGHAYQGYSAMNQSLLEEDEDNQGTRLRTDEEDVEAQTGRSVAHAHAFRQQRVSWAAPGVETSVLRPNIHHEDKIHEESESDDEVPQSFMIESPATRRPPPPPSSPNHGKGKARATPLRSRNVPPTTLPNYSGEQPISVPPRPSEIQTEGKLRPSPLSSPSPTRHPPDPLRGLDPYERALWNWVNVYNLDAFLQEVYYYYEGKGIYSIALSRGLNLLSVLSLFCICCDTDFCS